MIHKTVLLSTAIVWFYLIVPPPASAIDPGRVQGSLQVNGQAFALTQAYAHLHDNAERLLDRPRELRLLLVDREVPQEALAGHGLPALEHLAREGKLQGLLLKLDPKDHRRLELILLSPPPAPGQNLLTRTITNNGPKPVLELKMNPTRVGGTFECPPEPPQPESAGRPNLSCSLRFSAPLFHELPVTAILVGQAAQNSPQMQVLRARARALEQGDFSSVQRLSTHRAHREIQAAGPDAVSWAKQTAAQLRDSLERLQRVVVRGNRAVAVFADKQWQTFVREDGQWKTDN